MVGDGTWFSKDSHITMVRSLELTSQNTTEDDSQREKLDVGKFPLGVIYGKPNTELYRHMEIYSHEITYDVVISGEMER